MSSTTGTPDNTGPQVVQQPDKLPAKSVTVAQLVISSIVLATILIGGGWAIVGTVFCTKTENLESEMRVKESVKDTVSENKLRDWRIQTVEIRTQNIEQNVQRVGKNVDKLLDRFRVRKAPEAHTMPLPSPPFDTLEGIE
jgi:hypothetical protein